MPLSHAPIVHMEVPFQRARQFSQPNLRMPYAAQHHPAAHPMQDSFPPAKRARAEPPTRRLSLNDVSDSDPADSSASWTQHQMSSSSQHATGGASSANGASNGAGSDEKRRNFLERNRKAALKCRQKKKEYVKSLEDTVARLSAENEELHESVRQLHEQIMQMQQMMTDPMDGAFSSTRL
ncbi:Transcription factor [Polyrhizophydium stewartii]|uniref:Transcription factor n=1 Tax=Polyrhizophydium stewartii TaxID=2732419 RepID=A0ABR4N9K1_9FUNG